MFENFSNLIIRCEHIFWPGCTFRIEQVQLSYIDDDGKRNYEYHIKFSVYKDLGRPEEYLFTKQFANLEALGRYLDLAEAAKNLKPLRYSDFEKTSRKE